ncbi:MAG TPA: thioredoxin domain-containing protein [Pseudonocardiaceae bacterium]|nr:thioredoxin domain-containing protein [Pseudonocardiaceae bacterium]
MGSAQRTKRNRKQSSSAGSRVVSAARGSAGIGRGGTYAGIAVIVVLAVVVAVGVLLTRNRSTDTAIPPVQMSASYPVAVQDGVVVAGKPGAPTTVDAYEDFLCPVCDLFESQHAGNIQQALNTGRITVRYHMLNLLDDRSNPPGYSLQAANAGLCAANAGIFPSYHASLYGKQPQEGAAGYTLDQLVALGRALGAQGNFEPCVRSGTYNAQVKTQLAAAESNPAVSQQTPNGPSFGTPTVLINGKAIPVLTQTGSTQFNQLINPPGT